MYTVKDVYAIPSDELIRYVKQHYPSNIHFYITETQLRHLAVSFLDQEGLLTAHDSYIFHQPYFGQLYAVSGGDALVTTGRFFFNLIPGIDYLSYF